MSKQSIFTMVAILLTGGVVASVWYGMSQPGPRDLSLPPLHEEPGYTQPDDSIAEVPQDTVSYPHDEPDSPYIDLDAKLHVQRGLTLDSEIITINYELKDVALCGNTYKAKQIYIDGVDVVQRLSAILAVDRQKNDWFCKIVTDRAMDTGGIIKPNDEIHVSLGKDGAGYTFGISLGIGLKDLRSGLPHGWDFGFGGMVIPQENKINGPGGYYYGTLH